MRLLILSLITLIFTSPLLAAEAVSELSWTAPNTRADGSPLAPTEISEFRIYYGVDVDKPLVIDQSYTSVTGENAASISITLAPRARPYVVSFAATTVDTDGLESELSEIVTKTFTVKSTAKPSVPTSLQFTITCTDGCTITATQR